MLIRKRALRVCHLYKDLLNLYGDQGNVTVFCQRSEWRGIKIKKDLVSLKEKKFFGDYDFIFIGGGSDREQKIVTDDLLTYKRDSLIQAVQNGVTLLSICGGYQLLGQYYKTTTGEMIKGIGLFDAFTESGDLRLIGNVVVESELFSKVKTLVGFENHSGQTYLKKLKPIGRVIRGYGNNQSDHAEGAIYKNAFGTYLHGPVLSKNPHFADLLIKLALNRRYGEQELAPLDDCLEMENHIKLVERFCRP